MRTLVLFISLSISLISCRKLDDPTTYIVEKTSLNVAYGSHASQKMDIYLPGGRSVSSTKVMILVHGGGWIAGDKSDITPLIDTIKKRLPGYAIFNINYRLASAGTDLFPTQENDVKAAVEFIFNKSSEYKISGKYVMLGISAGAHLSLLHAYKYPVPVKIKAVVDFFGPTDLVAMYNNPASPLAPPSLLASVVGGTPATHLTLYTQSSPINFVTAQSPPTIILQGGLDPLVSPAQSLMLRTKLLANGVVHQYVFYPTELHGWAGANLKDSFDKIAAFLAANVN